MVVLVPRSTVSLHWRRTTNLLDLSNGSYFYKKILKNKKMKQEYVYVIDKDGKPLMPTRRFGKVKHLLKEGLAKVARRDVFTIQLLYEPKTHFVQDVTLGCDTGYTHIGISASTEQRELYSEETVINNNLQVYIKAEEYLRQHLYFINILNL